MAKKHPLMFMGKNNRIIYMMHQYILKERNYRWMKSDKYIKNISTIRNKHMKNLLFTLLVLTSSVVFAACTHTTTTKTDDVMVKDDSVIVEDAVMMEKDPMTVLLNSQNDSEQTGTAIISENEDGQLVITLQLSGGEFTDPQPAHIHVGACPTPGAVEYPLTNVVDGYSITMLDGLTLADVTGVTGGLAVNVHKSAAESSVYTACGDIL